MAFTINDIDLDEFNANTVKNPSVNEYFYAIKDVGEAPKTTMKRVVGGGYTNKGVEFGDSGDTWHIIKTSVASLNLREAADSDGMPVWQADEGFLILHSPPYGEITSSVTDSIPEGFEDSDSNTMSTEDFLAMELFINVSDTYADSSGLVQDFISLMGDSVCMQHPEMAAFYDSTGFYHWSRDSDTWKGGGDTPGPDLIDGEYDSESVTLFINRDELYVGKYGPAWAAELERNGS